MPVWLIAAIAWAAGIAVHIQASVLWPVAWSAVMLLLAGALCVLAYFTPRTASRVCMALAVFLLALSSTNWRAHARLDSLGAAVLPAPGTTLELRVRDLPIRQGQQWRFEAEVLDAGGHVMRHGLSRVRLHAPVALMPTVAPGQIWVLAVRLRPLDGLYNPGGWDPTRTLFVRGVQAQGAVMAKPPPRWVRHDGGGIDGWRLAIRQAIERQVQDPGNAGVLAGLSVGDQSAIERGDWQVFQRTGVAHLVSISGPHVLMVGWLAGWLLRRLWSRSALLCRWWPAPWAAAWMSVCAALLYALLAGWGIPAQRTVWMMATVTLLRTWGVQWPWVLVWACAGLLVLVLDPWALWQASFWLSFVAVGTMMLMAPVIDPLSARWGTDGLHPGGHEQAKGTSARLPWPRRAWHVIRPPLMSLWAVQWRASLVLSPVALMSFQSVSLVGLLANMLAIPWVGLLIVPLSLLGVAWSPAWDLAAWAVDVMRGALTWASAPDWAQWWMPLFPWWLGLWALLAAPWLVLRLPRHVSGWVAPPLVALCLLPPTWRTLPPPPQGHWAIVAADVGQGTAVVVQTAQHHLLFDAGVRYPSGGDMGERAVVPVLRALGARQLDLMVISHDDLDHHGGAASVMTALPVMALSSSLDPAHELLTHSDARRQVPPHRPCLAGQAWTWDGVRFEWLHPFESRNRSDQGGDNAHSCVLRVVAQGGQGAAVLLTGDIEADQESALVEALGRDGLQSEVLIVPHHGSATSSTASFLKAVNPREAVIQVGRHNRYGHPNPKVLLRLQRHVEQVLDTPACGAYWRRSDEAQGLCWRQQQQPYWHADRLKVSATASPQANERP